MKRVKRAWEEAKIRVEKGKSEQGKNRERKSGK